MAWNINERTDMKYWICMKTTLLKRIFKYCRSIFTGARVVIVTGCINALIPRVPSLPFYNGTLFILGVIMVYSFKYSQAKFSFFAWEYFFVVDIMERLIKVKILLLLLALVLILTWTLYFNKISLNKLINNFAKST